jgi:hypothetical protein
MKKDKKIFDNPRPPKLNFELVQVEFLLVLMVEPQFRPTPAARACRDN